MQLLQVIRVRIGGDGSGGPNNNELILALDSPLKIAGRRDAMIAVYDRAAISSSDGADPKPAIAGRSGPVDPSGVTHNIPAGGCPYKLQ